MRTAMELEKINRLIEGRVENPYELLGPHEVTEGDRRMVAVRAFLPESAQAWAEGEALTREQAIDLALAETG